MKKQLTLLLAASFSATMMLAQGYTKGKTGDSNYDYLSEYKPLKQYVDRDKYPNFKLGCAIGVDDYANNSTVRTVTNTYFDETVAGNAMKMGSVVNSNGDMNFSKVTTFVNNATKAGLNVYGHTLAWHSQQPIGWFSTLMKDRPAQDLTSGDEKVRVNVASKDFCTTQSIGWTSDKTTYGFTTNFSDTDGLKIHTTKLCTNSWDVQMVVMDNIVLDKGKSYKMKMQIKGSKAGTLHTKVGDWGSGPGANVAFTTEWKEVEVTYSNVIGSSFLMLQCGDFVGDIYIRNFSIGQDKWAKRINYEGKYLKFHATARNEQVYDNQFWLVTGSFAQGAKFEFQADVRADKDANASTQIHNAPTSYVHYEAIGTVPFTTEWKTIKLTGTLSKAGQSIAFNISELAEENNYYLDNISFKINGVEKIKNGNIEGTDFSSFKGKELGGGVVAPTASEGLSYLWMPTSTPQTAQEIHDTLVYAMDKWVKGMMTACGGKVKAWDLVNEAISGGGDDGQGNYTLQHRSGYNPANLTWDVGGDAFYWQDYMGDLEYVRQIHRLARKYGPEDIKLFINDYNLESDWDGNKKLISLINWIKKWEADGVTKIDGIGTQMHISCYMNANTMNSKKAAITNMFNLMAATGKYVRVSEFDMGMVDASGKNVPTAEMTEEMHKKMADFYEWIYKEYFRLVPPAQQWGICQWCATDSPSNSGWRANTPVGLWSLNYAYRKHAYAGVVRGLGGVVYTDINEVEAVEESEDAVFDLCGKRLNTSFEDLPAGLYIRNGKKAIKR